MPNTNYNSFIANYWSAIVCKKVRFCIPKTVLNFLILKVLLEDGYIRFFWEKTNQFEITAIDLNTSIHFNRVLNFSNKKRPVFLTFSKLLNLTKTGGYFVLSTKLGILNDSDAWFHKIGGILLFAIL